MDKNETREISPVLLEEDGTARVCHRCLVKWARKWTMDWSGMIVVCNACYRKLNK